MEKTPASANRNCRCFTSEYFIAVSVNERNNSTDLAQNLFYVYIYSIYGLRHLKTDIKKAMMFFRFVFAKREIRRLKKANKILYKKFCLNGLY
jgi:hypothetical protein